MRSGQGALMWPDDATLAREQILEYLSDLIAYRTEYPPGDSTQVAKYLTDVLTSMGYEPETYVSAPGLANVVARIGSGSTSIVFNAHVDTVDAGDPSLWMTNPYEANLRNDRVYGLGAANCKASVAVHLWLAGELIRQNIDPDIEVTFTFVTDEESLNTGGMSHLRELGVVKPDMLLLGAPTDNSLIITERGVLWVELTARGRSAHAGQPADGDNAITMMARLLCALDVELSRRLAQRISGPMWSTFNIGTIIGGVNNNVVPSRCTATIDRRLLPDETVADAYREIRELVASADVPTGAVNVKKTRGTEGFEGSATGPLLTSLSRAICEVTGRPPNFTTAVGVSDGRYFASDGVEIANFGPGSGTAGHAVDESVSVDALMESAQILSRCLRELAVR